jgi:hypothetical protein
MLKNISRERKRKRTRERERDVRNVLLRLWRETNHHHEEQKTERLGNVCSAPTKKIEFPEKER